MPGDRENSAFETMTTGVTFEATCDNGLALEKLAELIGQRERYLKGETTQNAVTATAINVLTSIRARTKVADPSSADSGFQVHPAPGVHAGWKTRPGMKYGVRVVRANGGHEMEGAKVVNLAGVHIKGEQPLCFVVLFKSPSFRKGFEADYKRCYVIAKSANDVKTWAKKKLSKYIKAYSGMMKWAVGQAQSQIWKAVAGQDDLAQTQRARKTALANNFVSVIGDGFNAGSFSVEYRNVLNYATLSLRGGAADVDMALQKAANRTAAIINKLAGYKLDEPIPTPFPEVAQK